MTMGSATLDMKAERSLGSAASSDQSKLRLKIFLIATVAAIVSIAVMRAWVCWGTDRYIDHAAGAWVALAADLKDGAFYRPLFGPSGYGGTRYSPLYFVLYAGLLKLGVPLLFSGYLLSAAAISLLLVGTFRLVRKLGTEPWLAACLAGTVLAAYSVQLSLLTTRADGLASALNVWGMAVSCDRRPSRARITFAALLFTLAWSTKLTTLFGFAAAFMWLLLSGHSHRAWELAATTACGCLAVTAAMFFMSQGRILKIFAACASGGANMIRTAVGPFHMLNVAGREDPGLLLFLLLALLALPAVSPRSLPWLFFAATTAATTVIFGSPGANFNHLLDVQVAAVVLFAAWVANSPRQKDFGIYGLAIATLLAAVPLAHKLKVEDRMIPPHRFERAIELIGNVEKPILAENPTVPVLAGQQPYVTDPFMLRVVSEHVPGFGEPLLEKLRSQAFGGVVLFMRDPRTDEGRAWYEQEHFGRGFLSALNANYRLASVLNGQFVYLPNNDAHNLGDPSLSDKSSPGLDGKSH
jgi:hypothetical protein